MCDGGGRCPLAHPSLPPWAAAYSPRPGTPAAVWDNQVADLIKADRLNRLNAGGWWVGGCRSTARQRQGARQQPRVLTTTTTRLPPAAVVNRVAEERAQRFAGRELEVLVEGPNPRDPEQAMGRTRHNKLLYFPGDGHALRGQLVTARVERVLAYTLHGRLVGA